MLPMMRIYISNVRHLAISRWHPNAITKNLSNPDCFPNLQYLYAQDTQSVRMMRKISWVKTIYVPSCYNLKNYPENVYNLHNPEFYEEILKFMWFNYNNSILRKK